MNALLTTMEATARRLEGWKDQRLSVQAPKPEPQMRLIASFPPAPREYRGLVLRRAGRGVRS